MSSPAIRIENLGKRYVVHHEQHGEGYTTLRESLMDLASAPIRRLRGERRRTKEQFWALKDVSFEVQPGEVVGVIGRNGAGKSTLLKVLSQITRPTTGRVELRGRVGSLLEVGTGFHPELSGRENIYLNGSILGMRRCEIQRRFDEIVAFAEIEQFLDTPVKRYSSGMYVRLAFAVAAYLEPEILLVDEVLAVGDAVFQKKCIDRMTALARSGCSLLFVSHNLDLIPRFCQRGVLLLDGKLSQEGNVHEILDRYRDSMMEYSSSGDLRKRPRQGSGKAKFTSLEFFDSDGVRLSAVPSSEDLRCVVEIESQYTTHNLSLAIIMRSAQGARIVTSLTEERGFKDSLTPGIHRFECRFRDLPIRPGRQLLFDVWMHDGDTVDFVEDACVLDVVERQPINYTHRPEHGHILCDYEWSRI